MATLFSEVATPGRKRRKTPPFHFPQTFGGDRPTPTPTPAPPAGAAWLSNLLHQFEGSTGARLSLSPFQKPQVEPQVPLSFKAPPLPTPSPPEEEEEERVLPLPPQPTTPLPPGYEWVPADEPMRIPIMVDEEVMDPVTLTLRTQKVPSGEYSFAYYWVPRKIEEKVETGPTAYQQWVMSEEKSQLDKNIEDLNQSIERLNEEIQRIRNDKSDAADRWRAELEETKRQYEGQLQLQREQLEQAKQQFASQEAAQAKQLNLETVINILTLFSRAAPQDRAAMLDILKARGIDIGSWLETFGVGNLPFTQVGTSRFAPGS